MKKIVPSILITTLMVAFVSCKKDYVCECNFSGYGTNVTYDTMFVDMKKKEAEDKCEDMNGSFFGVTVTCELE